MPTLPQSQLAAACASIAAVAANSINMGQAFLSADGVNFTIRATDQINWLTLTIPCTQVMESIQINAAKLAEIVNSIRTPDVTLSVVEGALVLKSKSGKRTLKASPSPYPAPTDFDAPVVSLSAGRLLEAVAFCEPAIPADGGNKPEREGLYLHSHDGTYRAVSFSGTLLHIFDVTRGTEDFGLTIASRTLSLLKKALPKDADLEMRTNNHRVSFKWDGGELIGAAIDMQFPKYLAYLERLAKPAGLLAVRGPEFIGAARSVISVGLEDKGVGSKKVRLHLKSEVSLHAQSQSGEGEEMADAEWVGPEFAISFASRLLEAGMSGFGDDELSVGISPLPVEFNAPPAPMIVRSIKRKDRVSYITPLRS